MHRPRVCVLMAFWFPLPLIEELAREYPATVFVVKNHSGPQFLAQEHAGWNTLFGIIDLAKRHPNVRVATIKGECGAALRAMGAKAIELPNVYSPAELALEPAPEKLPGFHIGLFGAFRPLKNGVGMAFAAALAARRLDEKVTLHINGTRMECGAPRDVAIITEICTRTGIEVVRHGWLDHEPFKLLAGSMRVVLAASFSETYNYVAADAVTAGTPVIGSDAIFWLPPAWRVNPDSTEALAQAMVQPWAIADGLDSLRAYNFVATRRLLATLAELGVTSRKKPATSASLCPS